MKKLFFLSAFIIILYILIAGILRTTMSSSCGGFAGEVGEFACPAFFKCYYKDIYPDASGTCRFIFDLLP